MLMLKRGKRVLTPQGSWIAIDFAGTDPADYPRPPLRTFDSKDSALVEAARWTNTNGRRPKIAPVPFRWAKQLRAELQVSTAEQQRRTEADAAWAAAQTAAAERRRLNPTREDILFARYQGD